MVGAPGAPHLSVPQRPALWWHLGLPDLRLERTEDIFLLCGGNASNSIQGVFWCRPLLPEVEKKKKKIHYLTLLAGSKGLSQKEMEPAEGGVGTWIPPTSPGPPLLSFDGSWSVCSAKFFFDHLAPWCLKHSSSQTQKPHLGGAVRLSTCPFLLYLMGRSHQCPNFRLSSGHKTWVHIPLA